MLVLNYDNSENTFLEEIAIIVVTTAPNSTTKPNSRTTMEKIRKKTDMLSATYH